MTITTTDHTPDTAADGYTAPYAPMILSPEDCRALRAATGYVVRLEGHTARLELTKTARVKAADGYTRTHIDLTRTISGEAGTLTRATFVELYPGGSWQALAQLVRAGDVLRLWAYEDNANGYTRAAEIVAGKWVDGCERFTHGYDRLYVDELRATVVRKGRTLIDGLLLAYSVCPQNSARAVEPAAPRAPRQLSAGAGGAR